MKTHHALISAFAILWTASAFLAHGQVSGIGTAARAGISAASPLAGACVDLVCAAATGGSAPVSDARKGAAEAFGGTDPNAAQKAKEYENPRCGPQGDGSYILCEEVPGFNPKQQDPAAFLRQLYILALALAGTVAFVQIVRGGILYSLSGVVNSKNEAKAIFKGVAQGLALLMGAYVILNTVNPALVNLKFPDAANYFPTIDVTREQRLAELKIEAANLYEAQQAKKMRDDRDTANVLQDQISAIERDPNRTAEDVKRVPELKEKRDYHILQERSAIEAKNNPLPKGAEKVNPNAMPAPRAPLFRATR